MKTLLQSLSTLTLCLLALPSCATAQAAEGLRQPTSQAAAASLPVKHFVAFKYKPEVTGEQKREVRARFMALKNLCLNEAGNKYIVSIEAGSANSPEGADQGLQDGFIVTFKSTADRDYYVGRPFSKVFDPAHDQFKAFVGPLLATDEQGHVNGVFVFDFETKRFQ